MADTYGYSYETAKTARRFTNTKRTVKGITIHHWGGTGQKFDNVIAWFCNPDTTAKTSAHYVAQGTNADGSIAKRVACIVDPDLIAWHAGDWQANVDTIGIECRPEARTADYDVVAELVARLWITYGVVPLYPHKHWVSTACPGKWDLAKIKTLATAKMAALKSDTTPVPPKPAAQKPTTVTVTLDKKRILAGQRVTVTSTAKGPAGEAVPGIHIFEWCYPGKTTWTEFKRVTAEGATATAVSTPGSDIIYRVRFDPTGSAYAIDWAPNVPIDVVTMADVVALEKRLAELDKS